MKGYHSEKSNNSILSRLNNNFFNWVNLTYYQNYVVLCLPEFSSCALPNLSPPSQFLSHKHIFLSPPPKKKNSYLSREDPPRFLSLLLLLQTLQTKSLLHEAIPLGGKQTNKQNTKQKIHRTTLKYHLRVQWWNWRWP